MTTHQERLRALEGPVAAELLQSAIPAQLAYTWLDGTPRVVPIWFHWDGEEFVLGSPPKAPKLKLLPGNPRVAPTIDGASWPYHVLLVRGTARFDLVDGVVPEYSLAARGYFGEEQGQAWVDRVAGMLPTMARIAIRPDWVGIIDFETRFPSAISP